MSLFCRDENYGLGAPNKGGLYLVDLNSGRTVATYIEPNVEGVFKRDAGIMNRILQVNVYMFVYELKCN